MTTYELTVAPGGPKLIEAVEEPASASRCTGTRRISSARTPYGEKGAGQISLTGPTSALSQTALRPAGSNSRRQNRTQGQLRIMLSWQPGPDQANSIASAVQDQLGLQLIPQQAQGKVFVIDRVEMP